MSVVVASSATGRASARRPAAAAWLRRRWWVVPAALAVVLLLVVLALPRGPYLEPGATNPDGGAALAALVQARGVEVVEVADSGEAVERAGAGDVVLVAPADGATAVSGQVLSGLDDGVRLVVVEPGALPQRLVGFVDDLASLPRAAALEPSCEVGAATAAGPVEVRGLVVAGGTTDGVCYDGRATEDGDGPPAGALVVRDDEAVLADGRPLTNDGLRRPGAAALALGLVLPADADGRLLWLVPDAGRENALVPPPDVPTPDLPEVGLLDLDAPDLLPPAVLTGVGLLLLAGLLAAAGRGRRLGPPVVEPLPVLVRGAEAAEGRARLYARGRAHGPSGQVLREATRARLAAALAVPDLPGRLDVAVAARCSAAPPQVAGLLYGAPAADEAALVALADGLDALEREVLG